MNFENIYKDSEDTSATESQVENNAIWKVDALGDDEVRELFNNIRNGNNSLDKQFVEKIYEIMPDMPHAVRILRGSDAADNNDFDRFAEEESSLFDSENVYYENENQSGVCDFHQLFDSIGDGKNPFEIYVATYSQSDGMENTVVLYYGDDWYMVCPWDEEKIKTALIDNILDTEYGPEVIKACYRKEFSQDFNSSNKSIF